MRIMEWEGDTTGGGEARSGEGEVRTGEREKTTNCGVLGSSLSFTTCL